MFSHLRKLLSVSAVVLAIIVLAPVSTAWAQNQPGTKSSVLPTGGGQGLDPNDTVFLFLDHQAGLFQTVKDIPVDDLRRNVEMLAKLATLMKIPVITTASEPSGTNGPLMPEIHQIAPHAVYVARKGEVNAWDNPDFVRAVEKTGKKTLRTRVQRLGGRCSHATGESCAEWLPIAASAATGRRRTGPRYPLAAEWPATADKPGLSAVRLGSQGRTRRGEGDSRATANDPTDGVPSGSLDRALCLAIAVRHHCHRSPLSLWLALPAALELTGRRSVHRARTDREAGDIAVLDSPTPPGVHGRRRTSFAAQFNKIRMAKAVAATSSIPITRHQCSW